MEHFQVRSDPDVGGSRRGARETVPVWTTTHRN
jgi:hypothetical protein